MLDKIRIARETVDDVLKLQESLAVIMEEENHINNLMQAMDVDNIVDLVYSAPILAYEEKIIDCENIEDENNLQEIEKAISQFYARRRTAIQTAIEEFESSEMYKTYMDVLGLKEKYENIAIGSKNDDSLAEYLSKELKKSIKDCVVTATYKLFIEPLQIVAIKADEIVLGTDSEWARGIIDYRFKDIIQEKLFGILGMNIKVTVIKV